MDGSPPDSSVHGILQARILEWVAISFSRDLPDPGIEPTSPSLALAGRFFTAEPPRKPCLVAAYYEHTLRTVRRLSSAQPISKQCWGWIGPCAFYCDCKTSFTNTHQETLEKMKVSYLQDLETTQHSEALWQGERAWAFAFIEVKYFVGSLFIGEFKTLRVRTQSMRREKTSGPNGQEWKSARSPTQRSLSGRSREVLCQVWGWHRVYPERRH